MKLYTEKEKNKLQNNLTVIRKVAGWTTADLGELIGVTKQTISNLENNKTIMTKTQYIAIRAILDYEISTNTENVALEQIVNILLDSPDLSEEESAKVETTMAYVTGAKQKGMSSAAISAGLATLVTALGIIGGPETSKLAGKTAVPLWLEAISATKRKK
nr:helix-turn-helix transcriptional regulator [uncultured Anaerosporobacter sp.]